MTSIDLGPAFTQIPKGMVSTVNPSSEPVTVNAYEDILLECGNANTVIYAPESIYSSRKALKLSSTNTSTTIAYSRGTINPKYKPEWTKQSATLDKTNKKLTIVLKGAVNTTNYTSNVTTTLAASDITVYIDGEEATGVTKSLTSANPTTGASVTHTLTLSNFEETIKQSGKSFMEWSGNVAIKIAGRGKATGTYTANVLKDSYGNQSMMETDETDGTWINVTVNDGTITQNTAGKMFTDFIKPKIEKTSSTKDTTNKKETIVFTVMDKYIDKSDLLTASDITVYVDGVAASSVTKTLTNTAITATVNGSTQTVGHKYTLVLSNFEQSTKQTGKNYLEWSGTVSIKIAAGAVKDKSSNTNDATTLTGDLVDFIKPRIEKTSSTKDATNKKETIVFTVMDKYIDTSDLLTASDITVYVDGEAASSVTKTLTNTAIKATVNGTSKTVGHTYTLVLSRFEQSTKQTGKNYLEWSGTVSIKIAAGAVKDTSSNTNDATTLTGDLVDFIKPRIEKTSSTKDATNKKETIVFTVMDKYIDTSDLLTASDITVYVDGETASNITKTLTNSAITATVNGSTQTVGHTYTLVLSNFEKTINSNGYRDWSGTVSISVAAGAVKDTSSNTNDATTLTGDYVDFINPTIKYTHQSTNIDKTNKKYVMEFTVTDKYYTSGQLTIDDLTINMQNGQKDANGNLIVYNLKNEPVTITLNATAITVASMKMTNTSNAVVTATNQTIGHRYTLTISNLEQLEVEEGFTTADYSGIVTVAIAGSKITDRTGNTNTATTITSGISLEGTTTSGSSTEVDVVDPILERVSSSANAVDQTATITFKGTDTYYASNAITAANIKVLVNGGTTEPTGITKSLSAVTKLEESRTVSGTTSTVQYGVQYTLTISGFSTTANQVKIQIPTGMVTDASGNTNKETELIVYNVLKSAASETVKTSGFLGNTSIARQDIENITFVSSLADSTGTDVKQVWDVSAQADGSIKAWTKQSVAPYTVYIGSDYEIFANQNSSYLFSYIGYGSSCTATETITNLNLLNTSSVTNMTEMFSHCGYIGMTSLNLGTFDTTNVINMYAMFQNCGYTAMTSLNLGSSFNTANVTNMSYMFNGTGYKAMETITLGSNFNTAKVADMSYMFKNCGYTKMKSLNLGSSFIASSVTNMSYMFEGCGYVALESLDLGDVFNPSKVTNMAGMFKNCGYTAMTNLDLGNKFDTSKVTNMTEMFYKCGYTKMTSLDLGELFYTDLVTDMSYMFQQCGREKMTALNLGDKFNTGGVLDFSYMFSECGYTSMTSLDLGNNFNLGSALKTRDMFNNCGNQSMTVLDLGPQFVYFEDDNESYDTMFEGCGKANSCVVYAPEAIYSNRTTFKTGRTSTITIDYSSQGTINPIYKPEWTKVSSALNTTNKTLAITVKGSSYKSQTIENTDVTINYASDVTSTLAAEDITVYIDGVDVTTYANPTVAVGAGSSATNSTSGKTEITHVITLSNFEEAVRQSGNSYKEWSGNVSIKIGGRGQATSTYTANVLTDSYGNQSMMATDETNGTWIDVEFKDGNVTANSSGTMFTDFIKPEFTYQYAESDVDHDLKTVKIVFSVVDKYFSSSSLTLNDLTILIDGEAPDWTKVTKEITSTTDVTATVDGVSKTIGKQYTLLLSELEQDAIVSGDNYLDYSGVVTVAIPAGKIADTSGNTNDAQTITMGFDLPTLGYTTPYLPTGYSYVEGNLDTGLVIQDASGNQYVWVEVPRTAQVYKTAGVNITEFTDIEYTNIENDLHTYTTIYRVDGYVDQYSSDAATGLTSSQYSELKKKMLKSVYQNGGFYVGRYETGTQNTYRVAEGEATETPVIKANAYPYNFVTNSQAQTLASSFGSGNFTSSLMFGVQWDLVLKYMDIKDATTAELNEDSTNWGNYKNTVAEITNTSAKYTTGDTTWTSAPYSKGNGTYMRFTTGSSDAFSKLGIYDFAGNVGEWTLEYTSSASYPSTRRGGQYYQDGNSQPANKHNNHTSTGSYNYLGFRVALYKDGAATEDEIIDVEDPIIGGEVADVVDPLWEAQNINIDKTNKKVTVDLIGTDKYFKTGELTTSNITVYVDGESASNITKSLSTATALTETRDGETVQYGVKYTLTLSGFEESAKQSGKSFLEWSGTVKIDVAEGTLTDQYTNTSNTQTFELGHADFIKPRIEKTSSTRDATAKTETIIFNVMDKYLDTTDELTANDITVYVDKETASSVTKTLTKVKDFTETVNGASQVVGQQYQLVISGFEKDRTTITDDRKYKDWSGTVEIEIASGAMKDTSGNTNDETTIVGDFVDFIKPEVVYQYASSDIDYDAKTFTMVFDVRDKYFANSTLTIDNFETIITEIMVLEGDGNIMNDVNVKKSITAVETVYQETSMNKTVDGTVQTGLTNQVIGKRYTILLEDLEQDVLTAVGNDYLNYSGVITVAIPEGMATDMGPAGDGTNPNGNAATTITSGVSIPGGTGTGTVVDVVDPIWQQVGTATAEPIRRKASIIISGTDKYIVSDTLTAADISVAVNGTVQDEDDGVTLTVTEDTSVSLAYGKQYIINVNGFVSDAHQVKLIFREGILTDESGNTSKETEFIIYSALRKTDTETLPTSPFLGEPTGTVERQKVEKIIFQHDLNGVNDTRWDVSAQEDGSIIAWYEETERGTYVVYIGGYTIKNGNPNSTNLFKYIGYDSACAVTGDTTASDDTAKPLIENLDYIHFDNVTNMSHMFDNFGYSTMKSLDLGSNFDTSAVTDMSRMFGGCGYTAMINIDLGDNFNTSSVTNMRAMFQNCGYTAMTSLDLGDNFDTSSVQDMNCMFDSCGETAMQTLTLGDKFDTSNVTNMSYMFEQCGKTSMTSLDLGDLFNTSKVTDMEFMFSQCGQFAMTSFDLGDKFDTSSVQDMQYMFHMFAYKLESLDLGDKFDTSSVTNMYRMFDECGLTAMTILDLGPAFTNIPDGTVISVNPSGDGSKIETGAHDNFISNFGTSTTVIYAPESIYENMKNFKLNSTSDTTIALDYSTQGTINPVYKPEWEKVSSTLDKEAGTMTLVIHGSANKVGTPVAGINYTSDVTYTLDPSKVTVYIDNEKADSIGKVVSTATETTNATTGKKEVTYTITLSNFEETLRQVGKSYTEWSGNISVQLAKGTLIDIYGNQNLAEIDISVAEDGTVTMNRIEIEDSTVNKNTDGVLFADVTKPEFTYKYMEADIDQTNKEVKVVFSVTDKYFESSSLTIDDLTILIDGETIDWSTNNGTDGKPTKTLTASTDDITATVNGTEKTIGKEYTLLLQNLEQTSIATGDNYLDYSGVITVAIAAGKVSDTSGNTNDAKTITMGVDLPGTGYIPAGYTQVAGTDLSTGLVVQDSDGNQYVWIEVPRTTEVYPTAGLEIKDFTDDEYDSIEADLQTYTATYRNGTDYVDEYYSDETTGLTSAEYTELKKTMLKSIYKNGGFYVGRYETGIADSYRTSGGDATETPVIKQNAYPYNWVTTSQAQTLSSGFASTGYKSSLMFGVQWDLILKYLETEGATEAELNENSTSWGNYYNSLWNVTNTSAKYYYNSTWSSGAYGEKTSSGYILLSTGASSGFGKQNIFDLAGNVWEWTLEYTSNTSNPNAGRGGSLGDNGSSYPGSIRSDSSTTTAMDYTGFRVALYKDEGTGADEEAISSAPVIADVVDPLWEVENIQLVAGATPEQSKLTADLIITDKYFEGVSDSTLTTEAEKLQYIIDSITVTVDGAAPTTGYVTKSISSPTELKETRDGEEVIYGHKYTLTLSNWVDSTKTFTDTNSKTRQYREYSGTTEITISAGIMKDQYGNTNKVQSFDLGHVDFLKPEIEKVSSTKDATAKTETIVFTVMDKYLDSTAGNEITTDEIEVYIDGERADGNADTTRNVTENLTHTEIKETRNVDGVNQDVVVGHEYTLVISNFEKLRASDGYEDWSGTVAIKVVANAIQDTSGNKNDVTTLVGDFVDFITPDLEYLNQSSATDTTDPTNKKYTMTFSITDKYYASGELTLADITNGNIEILMQNGQYQKDEDGNFVLDTDGNKIPIVYNLKDEPVTIALTSEEIRVASMPMTDTSDADAEYPDTIVTATNQLIGHKYTLTISNLEQLEIKTGLTTADYSGVITVAIPGSTNGTIVDTSGNKNDGHTITSGITIQAGATSGTEAEVDVVAPRWDRVSSSANSINQTGEITFNGTDTYFKQSTLTKDDIEVYVNGSLATGLTTSLTTATALNEQRLVSGTETSVQYGVQYKFTVSGFAQNVNQVKIKIPAGKLIDDSGNSNVATEMMVYNCLKVETDTISETMSDGTTWKHTQATSTFLGNTNIQRQDIENITFVSSLDDSTSDDVTQVWDVSAQGDGSIKAWTKQSSAPYTVYIGSNYEIFANQDSKYLFSYIGYGSNSTATQAVINLNLLNTSSVISMEQMFRYFGYTAMTSLDLGTFDTSNVRWMSTMFAYCGHKKMETFDIGDNFDTSKVIYMHWMFESFGYNKVTVLDLGDKFDTSNVTNMYGMFHITGRGNMTTLNLGDKFNTSNVTEMVHMFRGCGYMAMASLDLGELFDTSKVTDMSYMFNACGYTAMTSLDLGDKFDTSNVTNMSYMFYNTGHTAMTSLDLGDKFDTSNVTSMSDMFRACGYTALTSLDLGDKFYTTNVTDMRYMFYDCGATAMTKLDLGPAFTKIPTGTVTVVDEDGNTVEKEANEEFITGCGTSGLVIYAPEAIYSNRTTFK